MRFCWFLLAVNDATELNIILPQVYKEWDQVRMDFKKKSYCGLVDGCCGAIEVFSQPTVCPTIREVGGKVTACYSSHYENYGLN